MEVPERAVKRVRGGRHRSTEAPLPEGLSVDANLFGSADIDLVLKVSCVRRIGRLARATARESVPARNNECSNAS